MLQEQRAVCEGASGGQPHQQPGPGSLQTQSLECKFTSPHFWYIKRFPGSHSTAGLLEVPLVYGRSKVDVSAQIKYLFLQMVVVCVLPTFCTLEDFGC